MRLEEIVRDFAGGLVVADARGPTCKAYSPGIGPHDEPMLVQLVLAELRTFKPQAYLGAETEVAYGGSAGFCDLCLPLVAGPVPWEWALEIKAARALRNNGTPADDCIKQLLSPYSEDRSALSDSEKVLGFTASEHHGLLVYGYDYPARPLAPLLAALDTLLSQRVRVLDRAEAAFDGLIHPHHQRGLVTGWSLARL